MKHRYQKLCSAILKGAFFSINVKQNRLRPNFKKEWKIQMFRAVGVMSTCRGYNQMTFLSTDAGAPHELNYEFTSQTC